MQTCLTAHMSARVTAGSPGQASVPYQETMCYSTEKAPSLRHHFDRHSFCLQVNKKVSEEKLPSTAHYSDMQEGDVGEAPTHRVIRDIEYKSAVTDEVVDLEDRTKAYRVRAQSLPTYFDAAGTWSPIAQLGEPP